MRRRLVMAAVVAFLVGQIAVAAAGLAQPRPARWGWQMYSVADAAPRAWAVSDDGAQRPLDLAGRLAVLRADIRAADGMGRALCELEADSQAVIVELARSEAVRISCE